MVVAAHDLRGHLPRGAGGVRGIVLGPEPRNAQVGQLDLAGRVDQDVFRLDVPVDDVVFVQILECKY